MEEYSLRSQVFQTIRDDILKGSMKKMTNSGKQHWGRNLELAVHR